jgi:hypothetical protein
MLTVHNLELDIKLPCSRSPFNYHFDATSAGHTKGMRSRDIEGAAKLRLTQWRKPKMLQRRGEKCKIINL